MPRWVRPIGFKSRERTERFAEAVKRLYTSAIQPGRFVLRCSTAASLAYGLAMLVGVQHSVWVPISALVVSQESVGATLDSIRTYSVGTIIGVVVALSVDYFGRMIGLPLALQISISVAVCAVAASGRPTIRACLWTCPLILVTASSLGTPGFVGLIRASEVVLGAIVGGVTHVLDERIGTLVTARLLGTTRDEPSSHPRDKV
jgi:uncharacterized membrane protein YccC